MNLRQKISVGLIAVGLAGAVGFGRESYVAYRKSIEAKQRLEADSEAQEALSKIHNLESLTINLGGRRLGGITGVANPEKIEEVEEEIKTYKRLKQEVDSLDPKIKRRLEEGNKRITKYSSSMFLYCISIFTSLVGWGVGFYDESRRKIK